MGAVIPAGAPLSGNFSRIFTGLRCCQIACKENKEAHLRGVIEGIVILSTSWRLHGAQSNFSE